MIPSQQILLQLETLAALDEELDDPRWVTQRQVDEARRYAHEIAEFVTQSYLDSVMIDDREPGYERRIRAALEMIRARHERLSDETLFLQP